MCGSLLSIISNNFNQWRVICLVLLNQFHLDVLFCFHMYVTSYKYILIEKIILIFLNLITMSIDNWLSSNPYFLSKLVYGILSFLEYIRIMTVKGFIKQTYGVKFIRSLKPRTLLRSMLTDSIVPASRKTWAKQCPCVLLICACLFIY